MDNQLKKRIDEVTEQIELATEPDWIAWGLITRATIHTENGDTMAALQDLTTVIELPKTPLEKLEKALRKRSWIRFCANQYESALMDIEQIMVTAEMPRDRVLGARLQYNEIVRAAKEAGIEISMVDSESQPLQ